MTKTISGQNINEAYALAMYSFTNPREYVTRDSRNGPVREIWCPVATVYTKPRERVLFDETRDCNPFFHFFEGLWMLAGRNDVKFLDRFTKNMGLYSDDGKTLHGAYGHRWRYHFPDLGTNVHLDQLDEIIRHLQHSPESRRAVLQMWDPCVDLVAPGKDVPCNTAIYFYIREGELTMTVTNRSNDAIYGAYGANVVHMSMLHEYVASSIGVKVGRYYQFANSLHLYTDNPVAARCLRNPPTLPVVDPYTSRTVQVYPMFWGGATQDEFDGDLVDYFDMYEEPHAVKEHKFSTAFFREVVAPMHYAHSLYKLGDVKGAILYNGAYNLATDWALGAHYWLGRRGARNA